MVTDKTFRFGEGGRDAMRAAQRRGMEGQWKAPSEPTVLRSVRSRQTASVLSAQIPQYRVHSAKNLGYVRLSKRMIYLGKANTPESLQQYRRVVAEWLATGQASLRRRDSSVGGLSVNDIVNRFFDWACGYYLSQEGRPSRALESINAASKIVRAMYGDTPAAEFGPVALKAVREAMVTAALCRNVINQRVGRIKRIFRWAVSEELLPANMVHALSTVDPLRRGRSAARETKPVRAVPDEYVNAVLPYLPPTVQAMVRLQRLTGMRSGELCILRTCDVDMSGAVWVYRPHTHKTLYRDHERAVRLGPKAQAVLRPFLLPQDPPAFVFSPAQAQRERFATRFPRLQSAQRNRGRSAMPIGRRISDRYGPHSYRRALNYAMERAIKGDALSAEKKWHPHQIRHRHATDIRQARGLEAARVLLGHRTLSQTLEYAEADAAVATSLAMELG